MMNPSTKPKLTRLIVFYREVACRTVKVEKPGTVSCTSNGVGNSINTDCRQNTNTTYENVCTETPVSIDANLERENLEASKNMVVRAKIEKNNLYNRC